MAKSIRTQLAEVPTLGLEHHRSGPNRSADSAGHADKTTPVALRERAWHSRAIQSNATSSAGHNTEVFQASPSAICHQSEKELDRLEQQGIIEKVSHSEWAAPIVAVPKTDGRFCICGDYKVTVNQALSVKQYLLPKPDDLFATLAGGKVFSKLDLSQAYLQVQLDEKSTPYVTINTHQGLYRHMRLPFGVASAPHCSRR